MNTIKILISAILISVVSPASANGYFCNSTDYVEKLIIEDWGEDVAGRGIVGKSAIKLYVNKRTDKFSLVMLSPNNVSCIITGGTDWEFIYQEASHEDEDTLDSSN